MLTSADTVFCDIDAEPLSRYKAGGYHPTHLGDSLKSGRYRILHKLGSGGYSTVWLANDCELRRPVAIKILVSERCNSNEEASMSRLLSHGSMAHPGGRHIPNFLDCFELQGPDGHHQCLVQELLGPAMSSLAETFVDNRLPGRFAWKAVTQLVEAVAYLHHMNIVHGDIHPGNIVLATSALSGMSAEEVLGMMDKPTTSEIEALHGGSHTRHLPRYLVLPSSLPHTSLLENCGIKLIDFGSAFRSGQPPSSLRMRCPLPFRAPEAVITGRWDKEADIWSLACTIFALVVGYPPFDSFLSSEEELVSEWLATLGDLPTEWNESALLRNIGKAELEIANLSDWLHETYFDDDKRPYFSAADLKNIGDTILRLLVFRPSERPSADEILSDSLFHHFTPGIRLAPRSA